MKTTHTLNSPVLQSIAHRILPVHIRFHTPHRNSSRTPAQESSQAGTNLEPGSERFAGNSYYLVSEHEKDLERLIDVKTVVLRLTPNR